MESDEGYGNRHVARGVATILDVSDRRFTFDEGVTVNHQDDCRAPLDPLRGGERVRGTTASIHGARKEYNPSKEGTESRRWGGN